jgi:bifunctional DNA-binding transcriptional regulator/antitoxin component of YhaV-PrlF toxin-antitoxin module
MATESQLITTRIVSKGQIDVPDSYSDELGLEPGAEVTLIRVGNGLLIVPESETLGRLSISARAAMQSAELTEEDMLAGLQKSRHEVYEKLYGNKESRRGSKR